MNKVARSSITPSITRSFHNEGAMKGYEVRYPIAGIKNLSYDAELTKLGGYGHVLMRIEATLDVYDSRDGAVFEASFDIEEEDDLLLEEDGEGIGFIIPNTTIDLDEVAVMILQGNMPLTLHRDGSVLPSKIGEASFLEDDQIEEENHAWDALKDLNLDE